MRLSAIRNRRRTLSAAAALPFLVASVAGCAAGQTGTEEELLEAGRTWVDGYYHGATEAEDLHKLFTDECQDAFPEPDFWAVQNIESGLEREITDVTAEVNGDIGKIRFTQSGAFPSLVDTGTEQVVMPWRFEKGEWRNADCIADTN